MKRTISASAAQERCRVVQMMSAEAEMTAECFDLFRQACSAFERGDMEEHERLRIAYKELAELRRLIVERDGKPIH